MAEVERLQQAYELADADRQRLEEENARLRRELELRTNGRTNAHATPSGDGVGIRVADVERERISWLSPGRLALGKITILDGDPGLGKSTVVADLVAHHTTGRPWPPEDGPLYGEEEAGSAVIVTVEDGIGDTWKPRLEEAGADTRRVVIIDTIPKYDAELERDVDTVPALPDDIPTISKAVHQTGATLLVIDPLTAHLGGDVNSHRDSDIRRALAPLAKMASELHVAVLVIRHLNKQSGGNPMYRGGGSIGIIGAARLGMLLGRSPDEDGTLVLAPTKSNLSRLPASLSLEIVSSPGDDTVGVVRWLGPSPHSAYDVLNVKPPASTPALDAAKEWLMDELSDEEPHLASKMWRRSEAAGHKERTVRKALKELGIIVERIGGIADKGAWYWSLPKTAAPPKTADAGNVSKDKDCSHDDLRLPNTENIAALGLDAQKGGFNNSTVAALDETTDELPF